jgi:glutamyl-tRNA synthetase
MTVRTRFAPSPTGMLHIGGARTALFNYLFARHHGGRFLLRIEDTDRARSTEAAVQAILGGLAWLGLETDEPPIFQFPRAPRHAEVAHQMLAAGKAYRCWLTPDELKAMREANPQARIRSPWRDRDPSLAPSGVAPSIRLKAPQEGETVIDDLVQGTVRVANAELDDMIILRGDGTPTYQHAVVVDDHDMEITHVIRGDDHLTNTFRQAQIYDAMGWPRPRFAHLPLIHGADGHKLSKRHGAVSVLDFDQQGFLPEAVCNYLLRLGWAHGDLEIISREEAIRLFDIADANRAAARMDYVKLTHLNGVWIRAADDARLTRLTLERLAHRTDLALGTNAAHRIAALMPDLKQRAKTLNDLADAAAFLARPLPLPMEPKAAALLTAENRLLLRDVATALAAVDFSREAIDATLRELAEKNGLKLGQVAQPLRAALTGSTVSPGIDATLIALGRDEALARIAAASA